tara:strand:+ start:246 stop:461 length:216 start_codon:yes stop_codon:yes gene_type:complete
VVVDLLVQVHLVDLEAVLVVITQVEFSRVAQEAHMEIMEHLLNLHVLLEEAEAEHVLQLQIKMVEMENKFQ